MAQEAVPISSTSYSTASMAVTVPDGAAFGATVFVWKNAGSGFGFVDDVTFEYVEAAAPPPPPPATSTNLLANAGFESGMSSWVDWGNAVVVQAAGMSGSSGLRVGTAAGGAAQEVAVIAGGAYALSARVKVTAPGVAAELARLQTLRDRAGELKLGYWVEQIGIQTDVVRGFAAFRSGDAQAGIAALRQAATREDASEKNAVTPGPLLPAREVLATALLEAGDAAGALREFEAVLVKEPNRLRAMAGAALAAEKKGDAGKAREYTGKIARQTAQADVGIEGVQLARMSVTR